jgi:hypothetical protein
MRPRIAFHVSGECICASRELSFVEYSDHLLYADECSGN